MCIYFKRRDYLVQRVCLFTLEAASCKAKVLPFLKTVSIATFGCAYETKFQSLIDLFLHFIIQHLFDYHGGDQYRNLRQYLRMVIKRMSVSNEDRRISRQHVQSVFEELSGCMQNVEKCIFSKNIRKSGSYSTDTKIYAADEFDFDIPLKDSWSKDLLVRQSYFF